MRRVVIDDGDQPTSFGTQFSDGPGHPPASWELEAEAAEIAAVWEDPEPEPELRAAGLPSVGVDERRKQSSGLTERQRQLRRDWALPQGEVYVEVAPSQFSRLDTRDGSIDGLAIQGRKDSAPEDDEQKTMRQEATRMLRDGALVDRENARAAIEAEIARNSRLPMSPEENLPTLAEMRCAVPQRET